MNCELKGSLLALNSLDDVQNDFSRLENFVRMSFISIISQVKLTMPLVIRIVFLSCIVIKLLSKNGSSVVTMTSLNCPFPG